MYAQVTRAQARPGKADELIAVFRDAVLPAAREMNGYRRAYLLIDRETNRGIVVSLWETEADVAALATSGLYQEQSEKVAPFLTAPPEREVYEVAVEA